jgi:dihydroorotate dehydrogenase
VRELDMPVIAAGGIMDGAGIAAMLKRGAAAAQLGTTFTPRRAPYDRRVVPEDFWAVSV